MSRIKRGVTTSKKHKRILDAAKGYRGRRKNTIRVARQAVEKAGQYAYRDRKINKRNFRALWIQRINAAVRGIRLSAAGPPAAHARQRLAGILHSPPRQLAAGGAVLQEGWRIHTIRGRIPRNRKGRLPQWQPPLI